MTRYAAAASSRSAGALLVLASLAGCHLIAGTQDFTDAPLGGQGGAGGAAPASERCDNQVDDDQDGLADCDDPACKVAGFACADPPPQGWTGPVIVIAGDAPCAGDYGVEVARGGTSLDWDAASCACACDTRGACGAASGAIAVQDGGGCAAGCTLAPALNPSACVTVAASDAPMGCVSAAPGFAADGTVAGPWLGSCTPMDASPPLGPVTAIAPQVVCAQASVGAGCDAGRGCVQTEAGPRCVAREGDLACPDGYPLRTVLYQDHDDTRACSACSCTPPDCAGTLELHAAADCSDAPSLAQPVPDASCADLGTGPAVHLRYVVDGAPACAASTSTPSGSVTATKPLTVCCPEAP